MYDFPVCVAYRGGTQALRYIDFPAEVRRSDVFIFFSLVFFLPYSATSRIKRGWSIPKVTGDAYNMSLDREREWEKKREWVRPVPGLDFPDWYDIPTGWGQSFSGDLLKRRTNLEANPKRLISRGKPRRQGSGNMAVKTKGCTSSPLFSLSPSPHPPSLSLSFLLHRSFIQPGRRNEWELLYDLFCTSSDRLGTSAGLFSFFFSSFHHAIRP